MAIETLRECLIVLQSSGDATSKWFAVLAVLIFAFYAAWILEIFRLRKVKRFLREKSLLQEFADWEESKR